MRTHVLSGLFFVCLSASGARADILKELELCQSICSSACEQLANVVRDALTDYEDACSNKSCDKIAGFNACDGALSGSAETTCGKLVSDYCLSPAVISACEVAFDNDQNEVSCMQAAAPSHLSAGAVEACEAAMDNDSNELKCVDFAGAGPLDGAAINACEAAMENDTNELSCVQAAGARDLGVAEIEFCEKQGNNDTEELSCLQQF